MMLRYLAAALLLLGLTAIAPSAAAEAPARSLTPPPYTRQPGDEYAGKPHARCLALAQPPEAPFDAIWRSFYQAAAENIIDWDRCYESDASQEEYADPNTVYTIYRFFWSTDETIDALLNGAHVKDLMSPVMNSIMEVPQQCVEIYRADSHEKTGTAILWRIEDFVSKPSWQISDRRPLTAGGTNPTDDQARAVLTLDDGLKRQLEASGLNLAKTEAFSVRFDYYADGILFDDGVKQFFYLQNWVDTSWPRSILKPESTLPDLFYGSDIKMPAAYPQLSLGRLYSIEEIAAKDFRRMSDGEWLIEDTSGGAGQP